MLRAATEKGWLVQALARAERRKGAARSERQPHSVEWLPSRGTRARWPMPDLSAKKDVTPGHES